MGVCGLTGESGREVGPTSHLYDVMTCGDVDLSWFGDLRVCAVSNPQLSCTVIPPAVHVATSNQCTVVGIATADVRDWVTMETGGVKKGGKEVWFCTYVSTSTNVGELMSLLLA